MCFVFTLFVLFDVETRTNGAFHQKEWLKLAPTLTTLQQQPYMMLEHEYTATVFG